MPNLNSEESRRAPNDIEVLTFVQAVRRRPQLYVGTTDVKGLCSLVYLAALEAVEGTVPLAKARCATSIDIVLHGDNSVTVTDNGFGFPIEENEEDGKRVSLAQKLLTSGFVPSYNAAATINALSERLDVVIRRDGHMWEQNYREGEPVSELRRTGHSDEHGTTLHFFPDKSIFSVTHFDFDCVVQVLNKFVSEYDGVLVTLTDQREADPATHLPRRAQFQNTTR